jgi:hypothetical protein
MLDLNHLELYVTPTPPYREWVTALRLMGYVNVGLALAESDAEAFQAEAGTGIRCFRRVNEAPGDALPCLDACSLAEASRRRHPPSLMVIGPPDSLDDLDVLLGKHPNRVEVLELRIADLKSSFLADPLATFEWTSRLSRLAGSRELPVLLSSHAARVGELATPLTKEALAVTLKAGHGSGRARRKKFLRRLEQVVITRRKSGGE